MGTVDGAACAVSSAIARVARSTDSASTLRFREVRLHQQCAFASVLGVRQRREKEQDEERRHHAAPPRPSNSRSASAADIITNANETPYTPVYGPGAWAGSSRSQRCPAPARRSRKTRASIPPRPTAQPLPAWPPAADQESGQQRKHRMCSPLIRANRVNTAQAAPSPIPP